MRTSPRIRPFFPLLPLFLLAACHLSAADIAPTDPTMPTSTTPATPTDADLKSAEAFAHELESKVFANNLTFVNERFDCDAMLKTAMQGFTLPPATADAYCRGIKANFALSSLYGPLQLKPGSLHLKTIRVVAGQLRALFRVQTRQGITFHDYTLQKQPDSVWKITDAFNYETGEPLTQLFRRGYLPVVASEGKSGLAQLNPTEAACIEHREALEKLNAQFKQGLFAEVLKTGQGLPASLQEAKFLLLLRLQAAHQVGDAERESALKEFARLFPEDPALVMFELNIARTTDQCVQVIKRLEQIVGVDAALEGLQANLLCRDQKFAEAKKLAAAASALEPALFLPYDVLMQIAAQEKDFDAVLAQLINLKDKAGLDLEDPARIPILKDFAASAQAQKWKALHAK